MAQTITRANTSLLFSSFFIFLYTTHGGGTVLLLRVSQRRFTWPALRVKHSLQTKKEKKKEQKMETTVSEIIFWRRATIRESVIIRDRKSWDPS